MTAQVSDLFLIGADVWAVAGVRDGRLWEPGDAGLVVTPIGSSCWRGYRVTYEVVNGRVVLTSVRVGARSTTSDGRPPTIAGRPFVQSSAFGQLCEGLDIAFPLTGEVLVVRELVSAGERRINMGFRAPWQYVHARLLTFDCGALVTTTVLDQDMAQLRADVAAGRVADPDGDPGDDAGGWIRRRFSLDLSRAGLEPPHSTSE